MTHQQALSKLTGRCWDKKKIGNNTWLVRRSGGEDEGWTVAIRYHNTDILTWLPNGDIVLSSGGWRTVTTKQRLNEFVYGVRVWQENYEWFITPYSKGWGERQEFYDGMTLHSDGTIS